MKLISKRNQLLSFQSLVVAVLLVTLFAGTLFAQTGRGVIRGKVTETATGDPMVGTNVIIKDTNMGAATDIEGNFQINMVPPGTYTIEASFTGYKKHSMEVNVRAGDVTTVEISLDQDVLNLDEVIVTGMGGSQIKKKLGNTVSRVAPKDIVNADVPSIVSAMKGKAANVEITSSSGEPGASTFIRIRGSSTISGTNQPLFVVDGVPVDNSTNFNDSGLGRGIVQPNRASDFNPEDVESIEILKGAAAAAIYGSRASNGVVMITTKSGKPGKTRIEYKSSMSWDKVNAMPAQQQSYGQGYNYSESGSSTSWGNKLTDSDQRYDHAWELFETGKTTDNNLIISGGNDLTTFFLSLGRNFNDAIFKGKGDYDRASVRAKASQVITEDFKISVNMAYMNTKINYIQGMGNVSGLLLGALRTPPNRDNSIWKDPATGAQISYRYPDPSRNPYLTRGYDNPFWVLNEHTNTSDIGRITGNVRLDYDYSDWLNVNYTLGSDFTADKLFQVLPPGSSDEPTGWVNKEDRVRHEIDGNLIATAQLGKWLSKLNENFSGTLMAGQNLNRREYDYLRAEGRKMGVPSYQQLDGTVDRTTAENENLIHTESYFTQLTLDLYDQLYVTGAVRNDGSSTFSQNQRRFWYPKFSAAWEITKFDQMPEIPKLNFAKLRFAYGHTGGQPPVYSMITGFNAINPFMGQYNYRSSGTKGQEDVKPSRKKEFELGTDLAFFDSRLGLDYTYYSSSSEDELLFIPLSGLTGYTQQLQNGAVIDNWGHELVLSATPIKKSDFSWDLRFIFGKNNSEVKELRGIEDFYGMGGWDGYRNALVVGQPFGVCYDKDFLKFGNGSVYGGVDIDAAYPNAPNGALYIAEDGYPRNDPIDRIVGDPNPDWTASIGQEFTVFKNFRISSLIDIRHGGVVWNGTRGAMEYFGTAATTENREDDYVFDGYGPGAGEVVKLDHNYRVGGVGSSFYGPTSPYLEDGGYVKLREISLAYTLRNEFLKDLGLSHIDLRLSGRNLKTWTDYTGVDPETNNFGTSNTRGADYFNNPSTRSITFTLRVVY